VSGAGPVRDRDLIADHVAELDRALRGTHRARRGLLREVREGMQDTADGYRRVGIDAERAARLAVRDFGPVSALAPLYQEELAAAQGRRTALLLALGVPGLVIGWDLLWASGAAVAPTEPPHAIYALARFQEVAGGLIAITAVVLVLLTSRPARSPRRAVAAAVATALATIVACGGAAVAMLCVHGPAVWSRIAAQPAGALAYLISATMLVLVHRSAVRTLRALRGPAPC
jgi:hypothetical protein